MFLFESNTLSFKIFLIFKSVNPVLVNFLVLAFVFRAACVHVSVLLLEYLFATRNAADMVGSNFAIFANLMRPYNIGRVVIRKFTVFVISLCTVEKRTNNEYERKQTEHDSDAKLDEKFNNSTNHNT